VALAVTSASTVFGKGHGSAGIARTGKSANRTGTRYLRCRIAAVTFRISQKQDLMHRAIFDGLELPHASALA